MKRRFLVAGVLTAAALVTAACSGGSGSGSSSGGTTTTTTTAAATADPVEWTGAYCEGIGPALEGAMTLLKTLLQGGAADPAVQQKALITYIDTAAPGMTAAGEKLEKLGAPSAEAKELHDEIVKFLTTSGESAKDVRDKIAALDPADPEFATKLEQIGGDEGDPTKLKDQIQKLQNDKVLGEAFKKAPQCTKLAEQLKALGT